MNEKLKGLLVQELFAMRSNLAKVGMISDR